MNHTDSRTTNQAVEWLANRTIVSKKGHYVMISDFNLGEEWNWKKALLLEFMELGSFPSPLGFFTYQ